MSNSEVLGLQRITKKHLKDLCKKHKLFQTPHLNDQLYLHFQGFQSIENLEEYTGLKCLFLESNAISEIQGLESQTKLKCLFLQNNLITKIENLQCCPLLDNLNLSSNHITKIENCAIDVLPHLSSLNLSRNCIRDRLGIEELINCKKLWSLDLSHNRIDDILVVKIFGNMPELRVLVLQGNPVVSKVPQYRKTLILECKNLTFLDSRPVFPKDRACAEAWKRGGYEEERKELDRWTRMDHKKIRDSVNATLRLRQKHGNNDVQLLESSDDEDYIKKLKQIPEEDPVLEDLEITGVPKDGSYDLTDSSERSSLTSPKGSDNDIEEKNSSQKAIKEDSRKVYDKTLELPKNAASQEERGNYCEEISNLTDFDQLDSEGGVLVEVAEIERNEREDMAPKQLETVDIADECDSSFLSLSTTDQSTKTLDTCSSIESTSTDTDFEKSDIRDDSSEMEKVDDSYLEISEENNSSLLNSNASTKSTFSLSIAEKSNRNNDSVYESECLTLAEFDEESDTSFLSLSSCDSSEVNKLSSNRSSSSSTSTSTSSSDTSLESSFFNFSSEQRETRQLNIENDQLPKGDIIILDTEGNFHSETKSEELPENSEENTEADQRNYLLPTKEERSSKESDVLNQNEELSLSSESSFESPKVFIEEQNSNNNLAKPLVEIEERLRDIFAMIPTDEEQEENLSEVQHLSNDSELSKLSSLSEEIRGCSEKELERCIESVSDDRSLEDAVAANWLENFLANETNEENSSLKTPTEIVEDCNTSSSYDPTEDVAAASWLEQHLSEDTLLQQNIEDEKCGNQDQKEAMNNSFEEMEQHSKQSSDVDADDVVVSRGESSIQQSNEQNFTNSEPRLVFENEENSGQESISEIEEQNSKIKCITDEANVLEIGSESLSWWERTLAAAHDNLSSITSVASKDEKDYNIDSLEKENSEIFEKNLTDTSTFLESIVGEIEEPTLQSDSISEIGMVSTNILDSSSSTSDGYAETSNTSSTLHEVVTTFNEVANSIYPRSSQKSLLAKELIANPLTKSFSDQTGDQINRQIDELKQQKQKELENLIDYVYAQREKYEDTLELVDGRLMVVKQLTGALEELPPPPSTAIKYISCGISTTQTSSYCCCNDDNNGHSNSDDCGITGGFSEDKDNNDDDDNIEDIGHIEEHASDTKIKSVLYSSSDVNCANESVSLSSSDSSTKTEKEDLDDNYHHLDGYVDDDDDDDSRQALGVAGKLHNDNIDSETLPESGKCLEKE